MAGTHRRSWRCSRWRQEPLRSSWPTRRTAANLHGPLRTGFVPASHADWLMLVGCGVAIMVIGLVTNGRWALQTAARTAARYEATEQRTPAMTG